MTRIHGEIVMQLATRFGEDVTIESLNWTLQPSLQLSGRGLRVGGGTTPLIQVRSFIMDADPRKIFAEPRHAWRVLTERSASQIAPASLARWLKLVDPFLGERGEGLTVPITIEGPRNAPTFRPDWRNPPTTGRNDSAIWSHRPSNQVRYR